MILFLFIVDRAIEKADEHGYWLLQINDKAFSLVMSLFLTPFLL